MTGNAFGAPALDVIMKEETECEKTLRQISHGVYLQFFIGVGFLIVSSLSDEHSEIFTNPDLLGWMLILLGINSLIYINRYKKALNNDNKNIVRTS